MLRKCALLAFVIVAAGAQDLDPIRSVIVEVNKARLGDDVEAFSQLFARDGTLRIGDEIVARGQDAIQKALKRSQVWSEVTAPRIGKELVRFVSPDVALVDATQTRYGSLILKQSAPVTLLLRLDGGVWRIVSLWLPRPEPRPDP